VCVTSPDCIVVHEQNDGYGNEEQIYIH
jgi:hypothetical protein